MGVHDQMSGAPDAVSMIAACDELAHGPACCLLHGDSLGLRSGSQRFLLAVGESQCHRHDDMVSLRYHRGGSVRRALPPALLCATVGRSERREVVGRPGCGPWVIANVSFDDRYLTRRTQGTRGKEAVTSQCPSKLTTDRTIRSGATSPCQAFRVAPHLARKGPMALARRCPTASNGLGVEVVSPWPRRTREA